MKEDFFVIWWMRGRSKKKVTARKYRFLPFTELVNSVVLF